MAPGTMHRLSAFTLTPEGGNPAGVWIGDELPDPATMRRIAREVGYSETAFLAPGTGSNRVVRYYSAEAEVLFCGHATIAAGVVLAEAEGDGVYRLSTAVGEVPVSVRTVNGHREASLTSLDPTYLPAPEPLLTDALSALGWTRADLDPSIPPAKAFAGVWHLILAAARRERLATLDYPFDVLKAVMLRDELTTIQLIWRESDGVYRSRNPFPVGGVVEDPATGAAAAALGGYLREAKLITPPASLTIHQGEQMGRPSLLKVEVPVRGGIKIGRAHV